jgi:hypothetical protein
MSTTRSIRLALLSALAVTVASGPPVGSRTFAAALTAKQQCVKACRGRYLDCRNKKQIPAFECQNVYQDCIRYTCTGSGPG